MSEDHIAARDHAPDVHAATPKSATPDLRRCLECGLRANSVDGRRIYPHRPDLYSRRFWLCACGAYVGSHQGNGEPLGRPIGAEGRKARNAAHVAFDPLWKSGRMKRSDAYKWLADQLGQPAGQTHISWMTAAEAHRVVAVCDGAGNGTASTTDANRAPGLTS